MKLLFAFFCLMILAPALLVARATAELPVPGDDRETWRVGIMPFAGVDLESHDEWLARSIPLMFLESFSVLREHRLSNAERRIQQRRILDRALASAGRELDRERIARDRLFLADLTAETRAERQEAAMRRVVAAERELDRLRGLDASVIPVPSAKPIVFYREGRELLPSGLSRGRAARDHDLDMVIYGSVERLDPDFLIVEVFAYSVAQEQVVFVDAEVLSSDTVVGLLEEMATRMVETLLGRTWASLAIVTTERDAAIIVDGTLYGFGEVTARYLEPGPRRVVVVHEDIERTRTVVLLPSEQARLSIDLPVPEADHVLISSDPSGADVYVDSVWRGRTPLSLPRPAGSATVLLQRENHLDSRFLIEPQTADSISRVLAPDIVGWSEQTMSSRDRFYRSLGFFVLSLPVPIILNGVYDNLFILFADGTPQGLDPADANRLISAGSAVYWGYWGSVGVSSGLFVNMAVQLVRYIRTAESYHFH